MRILHLLHTNQLAGIERHISQLMEEVSRHGCEVGLICRPGTPLEHSAVEQKLSVFPAMGLAATVNRAKEFRPDILHVHTGWGELHAAFISATLPVPIISTRHFIRPGRLTGPKHRRIALGVVHKALDRRINAFIAVSGAVKAALVNENPQTEFRTAIIRHGIRPTPVNSQVRVAGSGRPVIICVSRLEREKGLHTLLDAMLIVSKVRPDAQLQVIGEGRLRNQLMERTAELQLEDKICFAGWLPDIERLLSFADMLVLPGWQEGFGLALLEGMNASLPCVACRVGGPKEVIVHGSTGYLTEPDDPDSLARGLLTLLQNPTMAKKMGESGRLRLLSNFTAERMAKETVAVYKKTLNSTNH